MKNSNRKIMAAMLYDEAKELGLELKIQGNWIEVRPPEKMPTQFLIDMGNCADELGELIKAEGAKA